MIWGGKKLTEEEIDAMYRQLFAEGYGPPVLAHLLSYECFVWDEIQPEPQLVALQNLGKRILKRIGEIREDNLVELTSRAITKVAPAKLREEQKP